MSTVVNVRTSHIRFLRDCINANLTIKKFFKIDEHLNVNVVTKH